MYSINLGLEIFNILVSVLIATLLTFPLIMLFGVKKDKKN